MYADQCEIPWKNLPRGIKAQLYNSIAIQLRWVHTHGEGHPWAT
jgi:hypothetical protein